MDINKLKQYLRDANIGHNSNFIIVSDMEFPVDFNCGVVFVARREILKTTDEYTLACSLKERFDYFSFYRYEETEVIDETKCSPEVQEILKTIEKVGIDERTLPKKTVGVLRYCAMTEDELQQARKIRDDKQSYDSFRPKNVEIKAQDRVIVAPADPIEEAAKKILEKQQPVSKEDRQLIISNLI